MRKIIAVASALVAFPVVGFAVDGPATLVNSAAVAYSQTPAQNLNAFGSPNSVARNLSAQVTVGSATIAAATFSGGRSSTGSVTVVSTAPLVAIAATDTLTMPTTAAILGAPATGQITVINTSTTTLIGLCITIHTNATAIFCNGAPGSWVAQTTASGTAKSIAEAITSAGQIDAAWGGGTSAVVYATATFNGSLGNLFTLATSSAPEISVSSSNFSGGKDPALRDASFVIGGTAYRNGYGWTDASGTSTSTAKSIANFLNSVSTTTTHAVGAVGNVTAVATGGVVTLTAGLPSALGNALTLSVLPASGGFTVGSALFTGGQSNAVVTIGGIPLTYGTDWTFGASTTTTTTAKSIAAAINANTILNQLIIATNTVNVVFTTATANAANRNFSLTALPVAALTATNGMTGGIDPAFTLGSSLIALPLHGFTTALPVLYTGTPAIGGLTTTTTYYVAVVDANSIRLSSTSAVAQIGNGIVVTSTPTASTTQATYTLTPGPFIQGPGSAKWQVSNDGINYADFTTTQGGIAVSSYTVANFTPVYPTATFAQDFGRVDYGYLRFNIVGPTQGGFNLKVILNAKD